MTRTRPTWKAFGQAVVARAKRGMGLWLSLLFVLIVGILLILLSLQIGEGTIAWHIVVRELGIACLISVVLALLIELNVTRRIAAGSLDTIISAIIPPDVWGEIRENIVSQAVVRDQYRVSMVMSEQPRADGFYLSATTIEYTLKSSKDFHTFSLDHELDAHHTGDENGQPLPRYVGLKINDEYSDETQLREKLAAKPFALRHPIVFARVGDEVKVSIELRELVKVPDSFTWWMSVTTRKPEFRVEKRPPNVNFEVQACHPRPELLKERTPGKTWEFSGIMLPGQGFEIRTKGG